MTNWICDDLGSLLRLRRLTAVSDWKGHGGITSVVTAEWRPGCRSRA